MAGKTQLTKSMITILGGVRINKDGEPSESIKEAIQVNGLKVPYNPATSDISNKPEWLTEVYEPQG